MSPSTSSRETSGLSEKQNELFPSGPYIKCIIFHKAHSFPWATLSENCSLFGTDNVRGQNIPHVFAPNEGYCLHRRESFTGKYTTGKIHTKLHPGLHYYYWRIFRILTTEDHLHLFFPLEHKIHIFSPPCNILYIQHEYTGLLSMMAFDLASDTLLHETLLSLINNKHIYSLEMED